MKKNNSSIALRVQNQKKSNQINLNKTLMTQSFAKLISLQSPKQFQRKPSHRMLDNKKNIQGKDCQKRICFISPQKCQLLKKVNQKHINFNTLTFKEESQFFSGNSSQMQSSIQSKKRKQNNIKQLLTIDLESNSSFFSQIQNLKSCDQSQSQKCIKQTHETNKTVNFVKKSTKTLNRSTNVPIKFNKENYTNRNQQNLFAKTIDKNIQLTQYIKKIKKESQQYEKCAKKYQIIIQNFNIQFQVKRKQLNSLNQKLQEKQKIIKKLKLEADQIYLLKASIRQIQKQRKVENHELLSLKLQNQKNTQTIKKLLSQIQLKNQQLDKLSIQTSSTISSTLNLTSRKRFSSNKQIISMKKINCLSTDIIDNSNELAIEQSQQRFRTKEQQLQKNVMKLQQEIKYKDIQILTLKKMKFQTNLYKQMSAKLIKQNQNIKNKLSNFQKLNKKSNINYRNNRVLSDLQFSLSPQKQ